MKFLLALFIVVLLFTFPWSSIVDTKALDAALPKSLTVGECPAEYEIQDGDTLGAIANRCSISTQQLLQANPAIRDPNRLIAGEMIAIPGGMQSSLNAASQSTPTTSPVIPVTGLRTYSIQPGDTMAGIAAANGISVAQLVEANPWITNPNLIVVGWQLVIPSTDSSGGRGLQQEPVTPNALAGQQSGEALASSTPQPTRVTIVPGYEPSSSDEHWINVNLATQTVQAYQGREVVRNFLVSTGTAAFPTVTGQYKIWIKLLKDDMRGPGYFLQNVPYVMYFYKGYGLHGTYWHHNFGTPMSHGCVNLSIEDAAWLYNFTSVGTVVVVE
jgi:lipoprotein-anchoring transpeptidase ErfK/SrfK